VFLVDSLGKLVLLEKLNGEGRGENALSEGSAADVAGEPHPKKVPNLDEAGDLGSGLSVLGGLKLSGCIGDCSSSSSSDLRTRWGGVGFLVTCNDIVSLWFECGWEPYEESLA